MSASDNRRQLALIFLVGFAPLLLAMAMYFGGWGLPEGRSNHGTLLDPVVPASALGLEDRENQPLAGYFAPAGVEDARWQLILLAPECRPEKCRELLHQMRQIHRALGRDAHRLARAAWLEGEGERVLADFPDVTPLRPAAAADRPGLDQHPYQIYLIDPLGNTVLRYGPGHSGEGLLEDIEHLFKLSHIG